MTSKGVLKIGDLGACKVCETDNTGCKTKIGTPMIWPPEIILDDVYSRMSDIWALGVLLHQLCTLNTPFEANKISALSQKIINHKHEPISK